jgi:hypothetical protein
MNKKTKIFFLIFVLLIIGSVSFTFYKIIILKDYVVEAQIDCDPESEACFIWECDPSSGDEWEACTGDMEADIWYYKIARRNASRISDCDPEMDEECDQWTCEIGEADCEETLCSQEDEEVGEACNDPEQYILDNPVEEEEIECEEGDEECLNSVEDLEMSEEEATEDDMVEDGATDDVISNEEDDAQI